MFVSNECAHVPTAADIRGAPDIVVEILSPSTAERDRTFTRTLYAKHGVGEYWLVDTAGENVTVLRLDDQGEFQVAGTYGAGETLKSPALPGFALNVDDLFRARDA